MRRFEDIYAFWENVNRISNHFFLTGQKINWEKLIKKVIAKTSETIDQLVKTIDQYKNLFTYYFVCFHNDASLDKSIL